MRTFRVGDLVTFSSTSYHGYYFKGILEVTEVVDTNIFNYKLSNSYYYSFADLVLYKAAEVLEFQNKLDKITNEKE